MKINAARLVTKTPWRLQKMKAGLTANSSAVALAASGPPRRQATRQVNSRVSAPVSRDSQRRATTFAPPMARNGTARATFSAPI